MREAAPTWTHANHDRFLNRLYVSSQSEMNAPAFAALLHSQAYTMDMGNTHPAPNAPAAFYPKDAELAQANAT